MSESRTTTIQVDVETWAMLDRLKQGRESFDDIVRRLMRENLSEGALKMARGEYDPTAAGIEFVESRELSMAEQRNRECEHYDPVSGKMCEADPVVVELYEAPGGMAREYRFDKCKEHRLEPLRERG